MNSPTTKGALSPQRRRLVELMQRLHFGRIVDLHLCAGQPVLDPLPRRIRDWKPGSESLTPPAASREDFLLKQQVVELFEYFDEVGDGVVDVIEVKHGLPFRLQHTEPSA